MQEENAIDDVITKTVNAAISRRVKELTRENRSDRALSLAREMVKQADGLPSSLPPPPRVSLPHQKAKRPRFLPLPRLFRVEQSSVQHRFCFKRHVNSRHPQRRSHTTNERSGTRISMSSLLCTVLRSVAQGRIDRCSKRDRTTREGQCDGMSDSQVQTDNPWLLSQRTIP